MAANTAAVFAITPNCPQARISGANTARDGSGSNLQTLFTAGSFGSRVDWIKFSSAQASAAALSGAMVWRIFVSDNAGTNLRLLLELAATSATASTTVIGAFGVVDFINGIATLNTTTLTNIGIVGGLILQSGQILKVGQSIYAGAQDQMDVTSRGGDF